VLEGVGTLGVVDVPGHEAFVRTMLAGATGVDLALLVVAADEGVMPQTREHLAILSLLGVRGGVVALTKRELADEDWLALVQEDVAALLAGSALAGAPVVPVSAQTGQGLAELRAALAACARALPARDAADLFRMPVDRAFTVKGTGTVVTGTVWSGSLAREATVRLLPEGRTVRVRGLQQHGGTVEQVRPGSRAAVALGGVEVSDIASGTMLVSDPQWAATRLMRATVALLDGAPALGPRTRVRFHLGTADVGARLVAPGGAVTAGERRGVRVVLDAPVAARAGDRFVLRSASPLATIGGGVINDPLPPHRRSRPWSEPAGSSSAQLRRLIEEAGAEGVARSSLAIRLGVPPASIERVVAELGGDVVRVGERLFAPGVLAALAERVAADVARYHGENPLEPGAPLGTIRARLGDPEVADAVVRRAVDAGRLELDGGLARVPGFAPASSGQQRERLDRLRAALEEAGREPPSVGELMAQHGSDVPALLRLLEREKQLVAVESDRYYAPAAVETLVEQMRAAMEPGREYSPAELREILGVSRKYLIPFLEYCDRRGVTGRRSAGRVLAGT
jgi:selenocysteine-specific elongation factor